MYRKFWIQTTIFFLILATSLGAFLRYLIVNPIAGIDFKNILHTHSHLAFMGWIFNALFIGLLYSFIPKDYSGGNKYHKLFLAFQLSVLGMLFSFPFQGYGAISIAFSTLHIVLSVILAVFFVKDKNKIFRGKSPLSLKFALAGLFFLLLSSFGPFGLGYLMAKKIEGPLSQLAIYFYLHFQYDGWFTFGVFALFYRLLERENILYLKKPARIFFLLMLFSCIPAYASSTLWTHPQAWIYAAAGIATIAQLLGIGYFIASVYKNIGQIKEAVPGWGWYLLCFAFGCFVFKSFMQAAGTYPVLADMAYNVRNFLIFYLHTIFLGFVSVFLFAWLGKYGFYQFRPIFLLTFLIAFIVSQLLIAGQPLLIMQLGYFIPHYNKVLLWVSLFMPLSLIFNAVYSFITNSTTRGWQPTLLLREREG